jgi:hypothetical protein
MEETSLKENEDLLEKVEYFGKKIILCLKMLNGCTLILPSVVHIDC